ncbi:phosphohistidine phosphatase SixA [Marinobacterium rhizophilum]|uniref:Phosphohistidine phosphatase SixA n=1 Tax=Marinobacterium rhizophilum TaxID=420402 RepID=A0ABY5HMY0_9GAMM|nr:phosphohistidine phosphatase SixA [Marinobacterium rhizophilum]UTW13289.1 phosphohistidine phosphatase SixA [Marinobacterium rhizophilum]
MKLFIMRHGEAGWDAPSDAQRSLTPAGTAAVKTMLAVHKDQLEGVTAIVSSPYLRARQTAALAASMLQVPTLEANSGFVPESAVVEALAQLEQLPWQGLLLVAHQPLLGNLVSTLVSGDARYAEPMDPGSLAVLELDWPAAGMAKLINKFNV